MADEIFGADEAEAILKRAVGRRSGSGVVTRERLLEMAAELDIPPEDVEAAIAETQTELEEASLRKEFIASRRGTILPHLIPFLSVNLMLFIIWALTGAGHPWFLYPLMGWGIGLACHYGAVWPTSGSAFEAGFAGFKATRIRKAKGTTRERRAAKRAETSVVPVADVEEPVIAANAPVYNTTPTTEETKNVLRTGR